MTHAPERRADVMPLTLAHVDEAVDVLSEAFADYPVMRFVLGKAGDAYPSHLRHLVRFLVRARLLGNGIVLGVRTSERDLAGVATIVKPGPTGPALELAAEREALWRKLGDDAAARYELYGRVSGTHTIESPHYHLPMIGVRRARSGQGLARGLLDVLHEHSRRDPASCGVTLNTEDPRNVPLYEHFGYRIIGHESIPGAFDVWSLFRADE